jgi:hypothetical protein
VWCLKVDDVVVWLDLVRENYAHFLLALHREDGVPRLIDQLKIKIKIPS